MLLTRISAGRTDLVFEWLADGGDPDAETDGASLLGWCAYYGDVSAIRALLAAGARQDTLDGNATLRGAAFHGHWRLCEFLIEQGADKDAADAETGERPLHAALCSRESYAHEQVVRVLLTAGADPDATCRNGAETGGFMRDVRTRGETPLHRAAAYGTLEAIRLLIDAGARLDSRDAHGDSPLTWASRALRDAAVLSSLSFGSFRVRPDRRSMADNLVGRPLDE